MPDSKPAPSADIPRPPSGTIPPPPPPNPAPASTNALGKDIKSIEDVLTDKLTPTTIVWIILGVVWVAFGLAGFIMSLWCLGFSGNGGEKFIGVLVAIILGPWYWLYFYSVPSYCARLPPPSLF